MLMTEDEAKTKWCPMSRYRSVRGEGINRWIERDDQAFVPDPAKCIASQCAMWRWHDAVNAAGEIVWTENPAKRPPIESRRGYCGLAGKPEIRP